MKYFILLTAALILLKTSAQPPAPPPKPVPELNLTVTVTYHWQDGENCTATTTLQNVPENHTQHVDVGKCDRGPITWYLN